MRKFIKQLFCCHDYKHTLDVWGFGEMDCYSVCKKCGRILFNGGHVG